MNDRNDSTVLGLALACLAVVLLLGVAGAGSAIFYVRSRAITQQAMAEARMQAELARQQQLEAIAATDRNARNVDSTLTESTNLREQNAMLQEKLDRAESNATSLTKQHQLQAEQMARQISELRRQVEILEQEILLLKGKD